MQLIVFGHTNNFRRENFNIQKNWFLFWFCQMDQFLVRSSTSYIMTPLPPPLPGDTVQNLKVGDQLLDNVQFPSYAGETRFIVFLSRIYDSISLNHLMMFVGHWWMDSHYLHIIKLNINKSHWPKIWSFIDVGDDNVYGSDGARILQLFLYH